MSGIGILLGGIAASPRMWVALRYGAIVLAVLLFLLSLRRSGERPERLAERLETTEKVNDVQRRMREVLAIATSLLTACATVGSEPRLATACPPVVEHSGALRAHVMDEAARLPAGSVIVAMTNDYSVMRHQARACRGFWHERARFIPAQSSVTVSTLSEKHRE
ncbi:MAG: hypothetical protein ACK4S2_06155 [Gemmobacter sp.]|uniref:hypothetical protein n=1 Tax=Gemmobacter sp. TaxID=1898957 RepID=UPI0039187252